MPFPPTPPHERFWKHVTPAAENDCWEWEGARQAGGYGFMYAGPLYYTGGRWVTAHRLSWEVHSGQRIPGGLNVLHHCDNPPCVNPAHLYIGTQAQNVRDRAARRRGREHRQEGEAHARAKLTEAQVRAIMADPRSQSQIAADYGVKQAQISKIKLKRQWAHLWME